jgi:hypothetical protein
MIQRIQTVYLFIACLLVALTGWMPMAEMARDSEVFRFTAKGIFNTATQELVINGWPLMAMAAIICVLQLVTIFLYKKRMLQIRISIFNLILMIGFIGVCWFFIHTSKKTMGEFVYAFKVAISFPLVAAILNYLAIRAIGSDEALIRSVDRIR